ncbi:hypothetical protein R5R35_003909 [Gryllus longicercus]|uniref:Uncharacterized protein n=1 Tax=Gryllus longicercus TaxID=2509291 RepID=A0AAN9V2K8_9ORTH
MSLVAHPQAKDCEEKPLVMDNADLQQGEHAAMGDPTEEPKAPEAEAPSKEGEATNVGCGEENRADLKIGDTKRSLSAANPDHCDIDPSAGDVPSVEAENKMAVFPPVEAEGKMVDAAKDGKARDDGEIEPPEGKAVHEIVEKGQVGDAPKTESGDVQDYDADVEKMEKKNEHEIEAEVTEESERKKREVSRLEEREREVAELVQHAEDLEKKAIHLEQQASILDQAADEMEREAIARQQAHEGRDDSDEDLEPDSASGSPEEKRFDWDGMIADLETKLAAARDRVEESKEARNVARSKLKRWKAADLASGAGLSEESGDSTAQASEDEDDDDISQKTTSDTAALEETAGGLKDNGEKAAGTSEDPAPTESLLRATFSEAKAKVSQAKKALTKVEHKLRRAKKEHREPLEPQVVKRQKLDKKAESIALKQSSSKTQLHAETEDNTAASKSLDERPKEKVNKADGAEGKPKGEKQLGADKMYLRPVEGGDVKVEQSVAKVDKEPEGEVDPAKRGRADGELQEHYVQEAEIKVAGKLATGEEEAEEKPEGCETTEPEEPVTSTDQDVVGAPATEPEPQTRAPEDEPIAARGPPTTSTAEVDVADSRLAPNVALLADESKVVAVEAEGDKAAGRGGRVGVEEEKEGGAALLPATHADSSSSDESAATVSILLTAELIWQGFFLC